MLLAAHRMLVEGQIERSAGEESSVTTTGAVQSYQVGDVRVTYAGGGAGYPNGYGATEYGRRFYDMMRLNFPAAATI